MKSIEALDEEAAEKVDKGGGNEMAGQKQNIKAVMTQTLEPQMETQTQDACWVGDTDREC